MDISSASFELMSELAAANPFEECEMKSETITLVAEVRVFFLLLQSLFYDWLIINLYRTSFQIFEKEEDLEMWQELFLLLVSLSSQGPVHAELVLKVVKRLSEHHIDHIKDLEGN